MELKVLKKQNNSEECIVCGLQNDASLKVRFYECDGGLICGIFHNEDFHQSFPGRMHGGMISAVLDETIGRAVMIKNPDQWGVTGELKVRYLKPTPLETNLHCWGKIVSENSRLFKGVGYLETPDGEVVATGEATYFKLELSTIAEGQLDEHNWYLEKGEAPATLTSKNIDLLDTLAQKIGK